MITIPVICWAQWRDGCRRRYTDVCAFVVDGASGICHTICNFRINVTAEQIVQCRNASRAFHRERQRTDVVYLTPFTYLAFIFKTTNAEWQNISTTTIIDVDDGGLTAAYRMVGIGLGEKSIFACSLHFRICRKMQIRQLRF